LRRFLDVGALENGRPARFKRQTFFFGNTTSEDINFCEVKNENSWIKCLLLSLFSPLPLQANTADGENEPESDSRRVPCSAEISLMAN